MRTYIEPYRGVLGSCLKFQLPAQIPAVYNNFSEKNCKTSTSMLKQPEHEMQSNAGAVNNLLMLLDSCKQMS